MCSKHQIELGSRKGDNKRGISDSVPLERGLGTLPRQIGIIPPSNDIQLLIFLFFIESTTLVLKTWYCNEFCQQNTTPVKSMGCWVGAVVCPPGSSLQHWGLSVLKDIAMNNFVAVTSSTPSGDTGLTDLYNSSFYIPWLLIMLGHSQKHWLLTLPAALPNPTPWNLFGLPISMTKYHIIFLWNVHGLSYMNGACHIAPGQGIIF